MAVEWGSCKSVAFKLKICTQSSFIFKKFRIKCVASYLGTDSTESNIFRNNCSHHPSSSSALPTLPAFIFSFLPAGFISLHSCLLMCFYLEATGCGQTIKWGKDDRKFCFVRYKTETKIKLNRNKTWWLVVTLCFHLFHLVLLTLEVRRHMPNSQLFHWFPRQLDFRFRAKFICTFHVCARY